MCIRDRYQRRVHGDSDSMLRLFTVAIVTASLLSSASALLEQKGVTFVSGKYCPNVTFGEEDARLSLREISRTGANWVAIVVTWYQDWTNSTDIYPLYDPVQASYYTFVSEKDEDVISIIEYAHELGLSVMLKPHIDLTKDPDPNHWRGDIGKNMTDDQWPQWFESYTKFITHFSTIAHRLGVEMFSISCELIEASKQEAGWREVVKAVRQTYYGLLTSSANWGGEEVNKAWWDTVDIIGVDAYYPIEKDNPTPTLKQLLKAWEPNVKILANLSAKWGKPVTFTEIGYCSGDCKRGNSSSPAWQEFQALHYEAAIRAFENEEWFLGHFFWAWNTDFAFGGKHDNCISPQWKPAEKVLRNFYGAEKPPLPRPSRPAKCLCTV
eukprot:TRINITY_DN1153_c0_g1_i4.p1 TRINITY_DN1153_c0_g1~~TRINITY_DN1153_c0_g1_i4.p1  ORF type:complete len:381 (+),score=81.58 TRINITY_DN1153_c0_g1_i4:65-1207(+)